MRILDQILKGRSPIDTQLLQQGDFIRTGKQTGEGLQSHCRSAEAVGKQQVAHFTVPFTVP